MQSRSNLKEKNRKEHTRMAVVIYEGILDDRKTCIDWIDG